MITEALGEAGKHPRVDGLDSFYESEIAPSLAKFDYARKRAGAIMWLMVVPVGLIILGLFTLTAIAELIVILGVPGIYFSYFFLSGRTAQVERDHAHFVASKVCQFFGLKYNDEPDLTYVERFQQLKLLPDSMQDIVDDDISGRINGVPVVLQDVRLEDQITGRSMMPVFQGLIVVAEFPKRFTGSTIISRDFPGLNLWKNLELKGQKAKFEHLEFEQHFEVFTTDQVECRYLLTPTFMERLIKVSDRFGRMVQAAFEDNQFMMVIETYRPWFESQWHLRDLTDPVATIRTVQDFLTVYDVIEGLYLNAKTSV